MVTYNIGATAPEFMMKGKNRELFEVKLRKDLTALFNPEVS